MNIEELRDYCLTFKAVTEELPFGPDTLVFKVHGKVFLLIGLNNPDSFNVKCDPEEAVRLREEYSEVVPGYHMNKKHWNTVSLNGRLNNQQLEKMIENSYWLVVGSLPKKVRESLA
ncbi:protein of unknown function DUF419 [Pseudopedobacter saltans DSM 12145]|uniref:MmcQ-like protein n=1 Tax=Pseudopedobacter saltans (strain ATCC 51119 / DSM 12145 / JCM 21818 / CCUG 39354 / LMG 10337 / NBRC 100064 / NCIMB 13643) TaxID=762903 RepID=F0S8X3_PSESL|nr:MmcQ/YjbR family DNA-binding protein [Pseudopedobacter saltans]ADY53460.1 protein of unknown function DUF419 [Pseudopedobacter saltans DSM 12145]